MSFLCKVVPWNLEIAPKAMGISVLAKHAAFLQMEGWSCREEPLGPSAGQKKNYRGKGCLGEAGEPAKYMRFQFWVSCQVCLYLLWATSAPWDFDRLPS